MFKTIGVVITCGLLATACMPTSGPETTQGLPTGMALEAFAPKFPIGVAKDTVQVAASPSTVTARLSNFARQCINGKTIRTQRTTGLGMPVGGAMLQTYRASISNEDGTKRLIISQQLSGAVVTTSAGYLPNVQFSMKILSDGAGGTTLSTVRNKTYFDLQKASVAWANGTSTSCPGLFAS